MRFVANRRSTWRWTRRGGGSEIRNPKAGNCSGVGQTSGLPVHGVSDSVFIGSPEHRARDPANRQTGGPMPLGFDPHHPGGTADNSPTFQCWVREFRSAQVPKGRLKPSANHQPSLRDVWDCGGGFPTLKRWAIVACPSGTMPWSGFAGLVWQQILEFRCQQGHGVGDSVNRQTGGLPHI